MSVDLERQVPDGQPPESTVSWRVDGGNGSGAVAGEPGRGGSARCLGRGATAVPDVRAASASRYPADIAGFPAYRYVRTPTCCGTAWWMGSASTKSPVGKRLRATTAADVRPLYEREPCSLLFGAWDSHRKGRWPKFARLYAATMYGLDPVAGTAAWAVDRLDPVNTHGRGGRHRQGREADWKFIPEGAKAKGTKLSEIRARQYRPEPGARRGNRVGNPPRRFDLPGGA